MVPRHNGRMREITWADVKAISDATGLSRNTVQKWRTGGVVNRANRETIERALMHIGVVPKKKARR